VTYLLLIYADDANLLGESICTVKKNAEALLVTSKETGLEHGRTTFYGTIIVGWCAGRTWKNNIKWYC